MIEAQKERNPQTQPKRHHTLRILTWHIHGSYLYYLTQCPHQFYLPVKPGRPEGYGGRSGSFAWGDNVCEVPAEQVRELDIDCILFQSGKNYFSDQDEILSETQKELPKIYLEHDPPREHPTDTRHPVNDPHVLLIHVTHFNNLMWDSGVTPTRVIEHGVLVPNGVRYTGELDRGLVVVNNLKKRSRRLGLDIFESVRKKIPLDLVGIGSEELGGLGAIPLENLPALEAKYRFFFNPIRYTSLGLAVCEAMMIGLPIVGLATTEMTSVVANETSGYVDTNVDRLVEVMKELLEEPKKAKAWSEGARAAATRRFNIQRFAADWDRAFQDTVGSASWVEPSPSVFLGERL